MSATEGRTWATSGFEERPAPYVFVQWKGTGVCLDFVCPCGFDGHYDGDFAYGLQCSRCGAVFTMPHTFGLIPGGDEDVAKPTEFPHDGGRAVSQLAFAVPVNEWTEDVAPSGESSPAPGGQRDQGTFKPMTASTTGDRTMRGGVPMRPEDAATYDQRTGVARPGDAPTPPGCPS